MGSRMARRLAEAGYPVTLWNRTATNCPDLPGTRRAATPGEAVATADLILLCLSDTAAVEEVVFGPGGVARHAPRGAILVDFSSIDAQATRRMAHRLHAEAGIDWVDAPVSGGTGGAETGTLIIMAGGHASHIERLAPVFSTLASRVTHMGECGSGQVTKACNQLIVAGNALLIAEATLLAKRAGVEAGKLADALAGGFADSKPLQILAPRIAARRYQPVQWKVATLLKDLESVLRLSASLDIKPGMAHTARELMARHAEQYDQDDLSTLGELYGKEDGCRDSAPT